MDPDAEIMTVHELAEYLRVSISTIYRLAERHELPGFKVGDWRFHRASVDAWMVQQAKVSKTAIYPPRGQTMSRYNFRTPTYQRAVLLKDLAFEICKRLGELVHIQSRGIARSYNWNCFNVFYADPKTSECDEYHHLDVRADRTKVRSVAWLENQPPEIVTFKPGTWEQYFLS